MSTTIVHLVRHGEVYNPANILYGRLPNFHLSARGQNQAAAAAESLRGHDVVSLTASPLTRTQETAQHFADVLDLEIGTDEELIEAGNRYEGLRIKGWRSQLWHPVRWPLMLNPLTPSWGEPYDEILARMMNAVERARVSAEGHEAVVVTHQLPIVMVQRSVADKHLAHNPSARQCNLASISSLIFKDDRIDQLVYSEPAKDI